jgi:hypothetical protein
MTDLGLANVFEDQRGIRRETGWLRRLTQKELLLGALPDGYGIAWVRLDCAEVVIAPMPWHTLVGWAFHAYWRWRLGPFGTGPSALEAAYLRGRDDERASWQERLSRRMRARLSDDELLDRHDLREHSSTRGKGQVH